VTSARWTFAVSREAPGQGRRAIREFAARAEPTAWALSAIGLCVTEAVTNVVVHAYQNGERPGRIEMDAELDGNVLSVRVRDYGHGLKPRVDSPGLGLGLPLIIRMSARSEIRSPTRGGTEITMQFNVHEEEETGPSLTTT
jgi:anti-sigma regulatory factor (Ser/Thr protein kinase)